MNTDESCECSTGETADEENNQDSLLMLLNRDCVVKRARSRTSKINLQHVHVATWCVTTRFSFISLVPKELGSFFTVHTYELRPTHGVQQFYLRPSTGSVFKHRA